MKRIGMAVLALGLFACGVRAQDAPAKAPATPPAKAPATPAAKAPAASAAQAPAAGLKTDKEKRSYAIGMEMGKGVKTQAIDVDSSILIQGLKDALSGAKPAMSEDAVKQEITKLQQDMRQKQTQAVEALGAENKAKGDAFLSANGKKDGVVSLPDGLQYKILAAGAGKKPADSDTVLCNYKGTFIDGTEFDSSEKAGKPVPFQVKNVIPGFREALQLMPVGSKWQVFIPANLGYGERGAGNVIPPNAALIFELEMVGIQDSEPSASGSAPAGGAPAK